MMQAALELIPDTSAPSKARQLLFGLMADHGCSASVELALLALSEVVTNAVRHGATEGSDPINVLIERTEDLVRVHVIQPRPVPPLPSIAEIPEGWPTNGYGLAIVEAVADRWGVHVDPPSVWFEVHL
jgi:anti-sigma regulatory factor (Ser/Thr protein kinase)